MEKTKLKFQYQAGKIQPLQATPRAKQTPSLSGPEQIMDVHFLHIQAR